MNERPRREREGVVRNLQKLPRDRGLWTAPWVFHEISRGFSSFPWVSGAFQMYSRRSMDFQVGVMGVPYSFRQLQRNSGSFIKFQGAWKTFLESCRVSRGIKGILRTESLISNETLKRLVETHLKPPESLSTAPKSSLSSPETSWNPAESPRKPNYFFFCWLEIEGYFLDEG